MRRLGSRSGVLLSGMALLLAGCAIESPPAAPGTSQVATADSCPSCCAADATATGDAGCCLGGDTSVVGSCCSSKSKAAALAQGGAEPQKIDLKVVNFPELDAAIQAHKGEVVVVDVWADFCRACKESFPDLVGLHHKYGPNGLVCISVTVDDVEGQEKALQFLQKSGAAFPNFLLNEEVDAWQKKWDISSIPAVFVYDRNSQLARKFDHNDTNRGFTYTDVEEMVRKLLSPKQ